VLEATPNNTTAAPLNVTEKAAPVNVSSPDGADTASKAPPPVHAQHQLETDRAVDRQIEHVEYIIKLILVNN